MHLSYEMKIFNIHELSSIILVWYIPLINIMNAKSNGNSNNNNRNGTGSNFSFFACSPLVKTYLTFSMIIIVITSSPPPPPSKLLFFLKFSSKITSPQISTEGTTQAIAILTQAHILLYYSTLLHFRLNVFTGN